MAISLQETREIRDRVHNLDLENLEHYDMYLDLGLDFITRNEIIGEIVNLHVYPDSKGWATIGYGFNIEAAGARGIWNEVIKDKLSFDEVINGKADITKEQADELAKFIKDKNLRRLEKLYPTTWTKLKANERIMIEDLCYCSWKLAGRGTDFLIYINNYGDKSHKKDLRSAVTEVRERSNPGRGKGIQNRRNVQATMGSSWECPIYSKPNESPVPQNSLVTAKLNETIIPRKSGNIEDNCTFSDRFYIWRTKFDDKVRPSHAKNDGKIFDTNAPPPTGNPGNQPNCRCIADFHIPNYVEIVEPLKNKHMVRKYIDDFSRFPNFVIK